MHVPYDFRDPQSGVKTMYKDKGKYSKYVWLPVSTNTGLYKNGKPER